jgi:signal transduction histidine kinase
VAADKHGLWNPVGASWSFVLLPFFYQAWWFEVTCGGMALLAVYVAASWRIRERHRIDQLERQIALEDQRKSIARDIHDELGASLTQIAQLCEAPLDPPGPPSSADAHRHRIAELAEEAVNSIAEIVWANNPRYDTLEDLVTFLREYAAKYLSVTPLDAQFDFPESVPPGPVPGLVRRQLVAVLKEALQNVLKHSGATAVNISVKLAQGSMELTITDNGCGSPMATASRSGNGLGNMRQRILEVGGSFEFAPAPGGGTRVCVEVPLLEGPVRLSI